MREFSKVINIKLLQAKIPYSPYNIYSEGSNNTLNIHNGTSDIPIIISPGYYTISSLMIAINSGLTVATDLEFVFHNTTKLITINNSGSTTHTINDLSGNPLLKRLGCTSSDISIPDAGRTFSNIPDLSIPYIDIIMDDLNTPLSELSLKHSNILKRIPLNGAPGDMIY